MTETAAHEAFLRAIYDTPGDELPRLVYADWLEERGGEAFAGAIRAACEFNRTPASETSLRGELAAIAEPFAQARYKHDYFAPDPWFLSPGAQVVELQAEWLLDPADLRDRSITRPGWFGDTRFKVRGGPITGGVAIETLLGSPCTARLAELDLSGQAIESETLLPDANDPDAMRFIDFEIVPVITLLGVEALCQHRGARRLTHLNLTNNNLDNDAARLLERSPVLQRLTRLDFFENNTIRGDTWSKLVARFGEDVVQ